MQLGPDARDRMSSMTTHAAQSNITTALPTPTGPPLRPRQVDEGELAHHRPLGLVPVPQRKHHDRVGSDEGMRVDGG